MQTATLCYYASSTALLGSKNKGVRRAKRAAGSAEKLPKTN